MSEAYAIKTTTLTALGDAIRGKAEQTRIEPLTYSVNEVAKRNCESYDNFTKEFVVSSTTTNMPNEFNSVFCNFKAIEGAKAVRIKGHIKLIGGGSTGDSVNFYFLPFEWKFGQGAPDYTNAIIYNLSVITYENRESKDIDIILDNTNIATLLINTNDYATFTVGYYLEVIGLDENYKSLNSGEIIINTQEVVKNTMTPLEMADAINELMVLPEEALIITGDCRYRFCYNGSNWLINNFGDKIITKNISKLENTFNSSNGIEDIPFELNISSICETIANCFAYCNKLKTVPYIIGPERTPPVNVYSDTIMTMNNLFNSCYMIREIPNDYFLKIVPNKDYWDKCGGIINKNYSSIFAKCYSLRELPDISMLKGYWTSVSTSLNYNLLNSCYSLNQVVNWPICGSYTSNSFSTSFDNAHRLKDIIFETNEDGTPITRNWKKQTIDLSKYVGYAQYKSNILDYNSGITADKEVIDDATYQALKNDEDWFSLDVNYSRYNHDSAVRTIASLPDCSATGTNTIKFKGAAGALTDGGAINTLTEEEIAVAAAKGWTVSLV